jgi:hypothetical protein
MQPEVPSWFKYRQGKAEPTADNTCRLTAPNLPEAFISIRQADNGRWSAALRLGLNNPAVAATAAEYETPVDAWAAAFELYRTYVVT